MSAAEFRDLWPTRGGPCYRGERALKLVRGEPGDINRLTLALVGVGWLPFFLLGLLNWWRTGSPESWMLDAPAHVRMLVGLPLLLLAEFALNVNWRLAIERLLGDGFVGGSEPQAARIVRGLRRWRDSAIVEGLLLAYVLAVGVVAVVTWQPPSPAGAYNFLVSRPLVQFLMLRLLWRWLVWAALLFRFSRLPLRLYATHPDRCGGIRFLVRPSLAFGIFLVALNVVIAAGWATQLSLGAVKLQQFIPELVTVLAVGVGLALGPLLVFVPNLIRAKREAVRDYGRLALDYVDKFHRRWITSRNTDEVLGTADLQSLADLGNSYQVVEDTRPVIPMVRDVVTLAVLMLIPMLPLVLFEVPVDVLLRRAAQAAFAVPL
jgi:hypothetical protein